MAKTQGKVHSIISNLVLVKVEGPVSQNEICFIEENGERLDRKSTRLNSSHSGQSRMPSSA